MIVAARGREARPFLGKPILMARDAASSLSRGRQEKCRLHETCSRSHGERGVNLCRVESGQCSSWARRPSLMRAPIESTMTQQENVSWISADGQCAANPSRLLSRACFWRRRIALWRPSPTTGRIWHPTAACQAARDWPGNTRADVGLRANSQVIFADDFESGVLGARWDETSNKGGNVLSYAAPDGGPEWGSAACRWRRTWVRTRAGD